MGILLYILLSIIICYFVIKLDFKYELSKDKIKSFTILGLRIFLSAFYFNILNSDSKIYFLSDVFRLRDYPEYSEYLIYFSLFIMIVYLLFPSVLLKKYFRKN